jgi:hypothetical protein
LLTIISGVLATSTLLDDAVCVSVRVPDNMPVADPVAE